jgi:hypothetical protein
MARPSLPADARRGDGDRAPRYARLIVDALARFLGAPGAPRRLVVLFCVAVTLVALAWLYPPAFREANRQARANARLDIIDRELGGGNSVLPSQAIAIEARGRIPEDGTFTVAVGPPQPGWSSLTIPPTVENYMRYFLLPRKIYPDAPWILCFACDRDAYPGAQTVWEDSARQLAILRRPQ